LNRHMTEVNLPVRPAKEPTVVAVPEKEVITQKTEA